MNEVGSHLPLGSVLDGGEAGRFAADIRVCGECSLCCKLLGVGSIQKPRGKMCKHQKKGVGCKIHSSGDYPSECRKFECMWLQDEEGLFGMDWRPDKLGLIWTTSSVNMVLCVWLERRNIGVLRREDVLRVLVNLSGAGYTIMGMIGKTVVPLAAPGGTAVEVADKMDKEIEKIKSELAEILEKDKK